MVFPRGKTLPGLVAIEEAHASTRELEAVNILPPIVEEVAKIAIRHRSVVGASELDDSSLPGFLGQIV